MTFVTGPEDAFDVPSFVEDVAYVTVPEATPAIPTFARDSVNTDPIAASPAFSATFSPSAAKPKYSGEVSPGIGDKINEIAATPTKNLVTLINLLFLTKNCLFSSSSIWNTSTSLYISSYARHSFLYSFNNVL